MCNASGQKKRLLVHNWHSEIGLYMYFKIPKYVNRDVLKLYMCTILSDNRQIQGNVNVLKWTQGSESIEVLRLGNFSFSKFAIFCQKICKFAIFRLKICKLKKKNTEKKKDVQSGRKWQSVGGGQANIFFFFFGLTAGVDLPIKIDLHRCKWSENFTCTQQMLYAHVSTIKSN